MYYEAVENGLSNADVNQITKEGVKSTLLTVIIHLLLPLSLFPFAFFIVPSFSEKSRELGVEVPALTALVFNLSDFVCQYWYLSILILGFAVTIDAVICFSIYRFKKKIIRHLWSGLVILIEAVFIGLCVLALLLSLHQMSNAPQLCPI